MLKLTICSLATVLVCCLALPNKLNNQIDDLDTEWINFKKNYGRQYETIEEELTRKQIFAENLESIRRHNKERFQAGLAAYSLEINEFADKTQKELKQKYTSGLNTNELMATYREMEQFGMLYVADPDEQLPEEVDWTQEGVVSPVKDQGNCGSCWAFAAVACLESIQARKTGRLIEFSEQELIDCSRRFGTNGCHGGFMNQAYEYIKSNGIDTEESYPYQNRYNLNIYQCRHRNSTIGVTIKGSQFLSFGDEQALKSAVANIGPISVGIYAMNNFHYYRSGVYDDEDCLNGVEFLNHGITVVGYGTTSDGRDYWKVKNSWGQRWGEEGYGFIARNQNNLCGIANYPVYPIL